MAIPSKPIILKAKEIPPSSPASKTKAEKEPEMDEDESSEDDVDSSGHLSGLSEDNESEIEVKEYWEENSNHEEFKWRSD
jgi:hypothetical protein